MTAAKHPRPKVGILLFDERDGDYVAHLQMRGVYDYRKGCNQTWPGICQVTVEGKKHQNESDLHALRRELHEELGQTAGEFVFRILVGDGVNKHNILFQDEHITIYCLMAPTGFFKDYGIRPEHITGGFRPVTRQDVSRLIVAWPKWRTTNHPYDLKSIVVKPHVKRALEIFYKKHRRPKVKK